MQLPDFDRNAGLIRAIALDVDSKEVLMDAYMNEEAWMETLRTGFAVYYSRTRQKLWRKGEKSGNKQLVHEIRINCNGDSALLFVKQLGGAACHEGYHSCFYRRIARVDFERAHGMPSLRLEQATIIAERIFDPVQVYEQ